MTSVLLVRLSAMGDLVQSLGAVASLCAVEPAARVTLVTQREWLPLLDGVPGIDRLVAFDRRAGLAGAARLRRELRGEAFDFALDLQGNWKSAMVTWLSRARRRIGMDRSWAQEPTSRLLLQRLVACDAPRHPARAAWELVKQLRPDAPFRHGRLIASAAELAAERARLGQLGLDASRAFRVLVISDPADPRGLRPALLTELAADGLPAVVLLGPAERRVEPPTLPGWSAVVRHRTGELRRLVALGELVRRAGGEVFGPDQGASHVLLAAGAPGRVYFGSQDPRRTAPPSARCFRHPDPPSCMPCRRRSCNHAGGVVCMAFAGRRPVEVASGLPPIDATGAGPWSGQSQ